MALLTCALLSVAFVRLAPAHTAAEARAALMLRLSAGGLDMAATAFLVGSGLKVSTPNRDTLFYALAGVGTIAALGMLYALFRVLRPSKKLTYEYRLSPKTLGTWVESDIPQPSHAQFLRALVAEYDGMTEQNEKLLEFIRAYYQWLVLGGSAQVIVWATLVWFRA